MVDLFVIAAVTYLKSAVDELLKAALEVLMRLLGLRGRDGRRRSLVNVPIHGETVLRYKIVVLRNFYLFLIIRYFG